jgi:hypothetical protein
VPFARDFVPEFPGEEEGKEMLETIPSGLRDSTLESVTILASRKKPGRDAEWDDPDELMEEEYDDEKEDVDEEEDDDFEEEEDEFGDDLEEFEEAESEFEELEDEEDADEETEDWDR